MDNKQLFELFSELEKLKTVQRQNITADHGRNENSAEHSWHIALMAVLMEEYVPQLDLLKTVKMLLIHDLGEMYAGDTSVFDNEARIAAESEERNGMVKFLQKLPEARRKHIMNLWEEYLSGTSEEARFARTLDALQPLINWAHLAPENSNPYEINASMIYDKKQFIKNDCPDLWPLTEYAIKKSIEKGLYS